MSLSALFYPKSIAVIGASTHEGNVGNEIAKNLSRGYRGRLYFVNPNAGKLFGRKIINDLLLVKKPLDLAIIAIPAAAVVAEVEKLLELRVKSIVVISAGFKEVGNKSEEEKLAKICKDNEITLIGPNCLGILNPEIKLNASFAPLLPPSGSIAFISQSGAICASVLDYARQRDLGFSKFVSVGNKALVGEVEILEYLYHDPSTKVIALYIEELEDIELLRKTAVEITHGKPHKPIVVLKAGRTDQGRQAARSHTGSMGSSDVAYDALFAQTGIIRAQTIDELFDFVECFARNKPLIRDGVAVITNAGGPGVLTADALVADGLRLAELSSATKEKLRRFLPAAASVHNPVDILGDALAKSYKETLKVILEDQNVAAVQIILTPQSMTEVEETAREIVALKKQSSKPLEVTFMGQGLVQRGLDILNRNKIATSHFPESASKALGALHSFSEWLRPRSTKPTRLEGIDKDKVQSILDKANAMDIDALSTEDSLEILGAYGFPVTKHWVITSREGIDDLSRKVDGLFALKIMSGDIIHKSDIGGVVLDVKAESLVSEYTKLMVHIKKVKPKAEILGVSVMPMVNDEGIEIILGVTTDSNLGKQILVGLGGIYTEALADTSWGLAPLSSSDIERMIAHLKTAKILAGFRGHGPFAADAVAKCLGKLSQLVSDFEQIAEVDINPLKVLGQKKGAVVLDARMVLL